MYDKIVAVADREGFEPSIGFHLYTRSRRAPSTTRPPVRIHLRRKARREWTGGRGAD